jgi:hypothetical protein
LILTAPLKSNFITHFDMHALDQAWDTIKRQFDSACTQAERAAQCRITNELNQFLRRLRQYQTQGEWTSAVLDAAARFAQRVALFELNNAMLSLRKQHQLHLPEDLSFPVGSGAAFSAAIQAKDPIVALRTPSEVTPALGSSGTSERAHVIPITNGTRVVAVLFATGEDDPDLSALELVAGIASAVLERRSNAALHSQISTHREIAAQEAPKNRVLPTWADLREDQRGLHIRAQRFSRVAVAEMQLSRPEACRAGREQANLYVFLKQEIDKARESYRKQFVTIPSMVDYFHLELVQGAADGDELKLGADYPGQLV